MAHIVTMERIRTGSVVFHSQILNLDHAITPNLLLSNNSFSVPFFSDKTTQARNQPKNTFFFSRRLDPDAPGIEKGKSKCYATTSYCPLHNSCFIDFDLARSRFSK